MRILQLAPQDDSPPFELQVRALEARGIECTTVTVPGSVGPNTSRSVVDYLRFHPAVLRESFGSYDLVHANYGLTVPFALAQPRLPVVCSLWGSDLDGELGWISRHAARFCEATIVMSERMRHSLGRPAHVIPHGVDLDVFRPQPRSSAVAELDWDPDARHVLFPYKPDRTVKHYERAARIVEAVDDACATPVTLQTAEGVPHERMSTYMNAADCLLLTSRREGSPNVVKEALACNLPVVSTDVGDVRERIDGVVPSAVCETDGALRQAVQTIVERGERSNGRAQATEIDAERMAADLEAVYRSVADERSVRTRPHADRMDEDRVADESENRSNADSIESDPVTALRTVDRSSRIRR
ncbi:glycosyltransferase [Halovivax gelatinilyticus]|uniref:glycosyltransferase n=1 Tax=Halovivax gelatinilyticus TaxID=2961597 RepID=UPI0020CA541D|nr:glycosyltransferase [Halovivax gelatinilyticus]